ncbi:MAG: hypothetical protein Q9216_002127 [Gyalolechia sp. 2 TL-2023]
MTDFSLPANHHGPAIVDPLIANGLSSAKPVPLPALGAEEEEDYTIKCICGFHDDDGNTVLCEHCETWQHTECYYFEDGEILDVTEVEHYCADCKPRRLDARSASDRQRKRREQSDLGERKVKKTPTKSHKKKGKTPDTQIALSNGCSPYGRNDSHGIPERPAETPRDCYSSVKRPKINHRYSNSLQSPSQSGAGNDKRAGSTSRGAHSPSKTPGKYPADGYLSEPYSHEFIHLYDDDPGDVIMQANLFNDITITSSLSLWTQDAEALAEASNGYSPQDIFHRCDQSLDSMGFPFLHKESKQGDNLDADDRVPRWKFLVTDAPLVKGSIVGELKGKVGHMRDYVQDPTNRWDYLRHPAPFVFFHPKLPIYIDTRREGTKCRYLRRSCRPNLTMTTILENGSDYRFCFVAKADLEASSELTIGWTLDQHIRNFFHRRSSEQFKHEGTSDADEDYVFDWVGKVLADFGGCACDSPAECSLAKYDRRSKAFLDGLSRTSNGNLPKGRNGSGRRQSPITDRTTYGRSHYTKQQEEEDDDRSDSGSLHSKQRSREITPTRNQVGETAFVIGLELSDREKRKIAALEKNFEQREQDKNQPAQKKKKRNSGGSSVQTPMNLGPRRAGQISSLSQPNTPGIISRPQYVDVSTSRPTSGSPAARDPYTTHTVNGNPISQKKQFSSTRTMSSSPPTARPNYVSTSVQTEPDEWTDWYRLPEREQPRRPFMSLSKQLLLRSQRERARMEQRLHAAASRMGQILESVQGSHGNHVVLSQARDDIETEDVQHKLDHSLDEVTSNAPLQKLRPPDGMSSPNDHSTTIKPLPPLAILNVTRGTDLQVQLPPAVPQLHNERSSGSTREFSQSPVAVRPPFAHTSGTYPPLLPNSNFNLVQPSPVKKKVSLGEYMSRRNNRPEPPSTGESPINSSPVLLHDPVKPPLDTEEAKNVDDRGGAVVNAVKQEDGGLMDQGN